MTTDVSAARELAEKLKSIKAIAQDVYMHSKKSAISLS